jgi:uncharacterized protein
MVATDIQVRLRRILRGRGGLRLALLFGSHATGRAHAGSDVDLAVAGDIDPLALSAELEEELGVVVDVVALDDVGYPLLGQLLRHGIAVHEGTRGAAASWRSHALATAETDRPWFERMRRSWLRHVAAGGI